MKKSNILHSLIFALVSLIFFSCTDESENNDSTPDMSMYEMIASEELSELNAVAHIYATEKLFAGYNKFVVALYDVETNELLSSSKVKLMPMMDMVEMGMMHSAPVDQPTVGDDNLYYGGIVFQMASMGDMGIWTLNLKVEDETQNISSTVEIEIEVMDKQSTYQGEDATYQTVIRRKLEDKTYIFSYYFVDGEPAVKSNDVVLTAHVMEDMMTFTPLTNLNVEWKPTMPSMGHGSPGNENPTEIKDGYYQGVLNFTMTGDWLVDLKISSDEMEYLNSLEDESHHSFYLEF
ncbi:FixH family protein [Sediminitomix flava]|uniref:YtkA-like protein n=1 Tax=Sediminitomix flava TaxID=379075 RepID=A0A315ZGP7_SEDFL|nr:FixH family protein [Sediminitomix flava]PWJ43914.1 YtkA-like protein [Sediminitomix flava]